MNKNLTILLIKWCKLCVEINDIEISRFEPYFIYAAGGMLMRLADFYIRPSETVVTT